MKNRTTYTVIHRFYFFAPKVCYNSKEVEEYLKEMKDYLLTSYPTDHTSFIIIKCDELNNDRIVKIGKDYSDIIQRCESA